MGEVCLPAYGDKVVCFVLNWKRDLLKIYLFLKHITSEFEHRAEKEYKKGGMQKLCSQKFEINVLQR